jgi:23S rRNA (guanosine2251-2'-O)-methyltransferase
MSDLRPPRRDQPPRRRDRRGRSSRPPTPGRAYGRAPVDAGRWLYGAHAVAAALANPERRWHQLTILAGHEGQARALVAGARATWLGMGEAVRLLDYNAFATILPAGAVHQGLALEVEPLPERGLNEIVRSAITAAGLSIIVVLDRISDPQNIGAILRSAAAFGARAIVAPARGTPSATGALAKAASGALEIVPLVRVVNLARALDRLKGAGFWICGLDETATQPLAQLELGDRVALVLGSEGGGMRRLVRERCDFLARLPTRPEQPTLNVANAAAVALYELVRSPSLPGPRHSFGGCPT